MSDLISRQAAIDVVGIDEEIRCEMCENPMHTDRGCDGGYIYDEKLYKRIMQILDERIKPLPSAQPEPLTDKEQRILVDEKRELELNLIALAEEMRKLYWKWKPEGKYLVMKADHENEPYDIMVFDDDSLHEGRISELDVDKRLNRGLYIDTIHDGAGGFEFQHFNSEGRDVSPLYDERKKDG